MLVLGIWVTYSQAALTGNQIGEKMHSIIEDLATAKTFLGIDVGVLAGEFGEVVAAICGEGVGTGVGTLAGIGNAFEECEQAMVGLEMSQIGTSLGLALRSYAGVGGLLLEGITAAEEAAVLVADAGALAEIFVVNSALCGLLIAVLDEALSSSATSLCSAVESAAASIAGSKTASSSTSSSHSSTSTTSQPSTSSSPANPSPTPNPPPGLTIPSVAQGSCASCQLSVYAIGIQGLAAACHVATPLGTANDVSVLLCDSSYNGLYSQFCATLCANPCATYNINSWIQSAGSQFMPNANLAGCASLCPGFQGDGRCSSSTTCGCAVGSNTCGTC